MCIRDSLMFDRNTKTITCWRIEGYWKEIKLLLGLPEDAKLLLNPIISEAGFVAVQVGDKVLLLKRRKLRQWDLDYEIYLTDHIFSSEEEAEEWVIENYKEKLKGKLPSLRTRRNAWKGEMLARDFPAVIGGVCMLRVDGYGNLYIAKDSKIWRLSFSNYLALYSFIYKAHKLGYEKALKKTRAKPVEIQFDPNNSNLWDVWRVIERNLELVAPYIGEENVEKVLEWAVSKELGR